MQGDKKNRKGNNETNLSVEQWLTNYQTIRAFMGSKLVASYHTCDLLPH